MNAWTKKPYLDLTPDKLTNEQKYLIFVDEYDSIIQNLPTIQVRILFYLRKGYIDIYELMEQMGEARITLTNNLEKLKKLDLILKKPKKLHKNGRTRFFYKPNW